MISPDTASSFLASALLLFVSLLAPPLGSQEPVDAKPALRSSLTAWLGQQDSAAQYEDYLVPHRNGLLRALSEGSPWVPAGGTNARLYSLQDCLTRLDKSAKTKNSESPTRIEDEDARTLFRLVDAMRRNGDSIEPLLPYLLLVRDSRPDDPLVSLFVFEAYAVDGLDRGRARDAARSFSEGVMSASTLPSFRDRGAHIMSFVFEAEAIEGGLLTMARLVQGLGDEDVACDQPIGPFAMGRLYMPELDKTYEAAMQKGDWKEVGKTLQYMVTVLPSDRSPGLIFALQSRKRDLLAFDYNSLSPEGRAAANARLHRLGLGMLAPGSPGDLVEQLASSRHDPCWFFDDSLDQRISNCANAISRAEGGYHQAVARAANARALAEAAEARANSDLKKYRPDHLRRAASYRQQERDAITASVNYDADRVRASQQRQALEAERDALRQRRLAFRLG